MTPDDVAALRQAQSVPVLDRFEAWMADRIDVLPKSPLGKAIGYAQNNWTALRRYTEDGRFAIDNNAAERAIRPVAVGRKNWLFAGSERGGRAAATFFTLLESARRNGLNPYDYLRDVFTRLPAHPINRLDEFLPDQWKPGSRPA
jgi:transposase